MQEMDSDMSAHVKDLNNDMANRMSLFYANATPMLRVLSDATSSFVSEVHNYVTLTVIMFITT